MSASTIDTAGAPPEAPPTRDEILALIRRENAENAAAAATDDPSDPEDAAPAPPPAPGPLLPKDTFSFLAFAPLSHPAFWTALVCFVVQCFSLGVVTQDQFASGNNSQDNVLGVPPYLRTTVQMSQFFAITIAVICQSDMLWSINLLFKGYRQDHFEHYFDVMPRGLRLRWALSLLARLIVGLFCLFVMFLLIMRADTSRTVLLSFAPVLFIGNLDNAIFGLAKWGYFGDAVKATADHGVIGDVNFTQVAAGVFGCMRVVRSLSVLAIWAILISFWAVLTNKQNRGQFLPASIYVQLGDDEIPYLGMYSDVYNLTLDEDNEPTWASLGRGSIKQFRYCTNGKYWAFAANLDKNVKEDECKGWRMKSPTTMSYNLLSTASLKWKINPSEERLGQVQMDGARMINRNGIGTCRPGYYGPKCEFKEPCRAITMKGAMFRLGEAFPVHGISLNEDNGELSKPFIASTNVDRQGPTGKLSLLTEGGEPVISYQNPVYYSVVDLSGTTSAIDGLSSIFTVYEVVMCVGRRWSRLIIGIPLAEEEAAGLIADKVRLLDELFHDVKGYRSARRYITHLSESFNVNTLQDTGLPVGFRFYPINDELAPNMANGEPTTMHCLCSICTVSDDVLEKKFEVTNPMSPFFEQNMTCSGMLASATSYGEASIQCKALQMQSVFPCGCPYEVPTDQHCPLCPNGAPVDDTFVDVVPYPGGGILPQTSCGQLSLSLDFRAKSKIEDNEDYCPSMQYGYGGECGCAGVPAPPCDIKCPVEGNVFDKTRVVATFEPNPSWEGWYCGEIQTFVSQEKNELCVEAVTKSLADACCTSPTEV